MMLCTTRLYASKSLTAAFSARLPFIDLIPNLRHGKKSSCTQEVILGNTILDTPIFLSLFLSLSLPPPLLPKIPLLSLYCFLPNDFCLSA